jgi:hypothetical protein
MQKEYIIQKEYSVTICKQNGRNFNEKTLIIKSLLIYHS